MLSTVLNSSITCAFSWMKGSLQCHCCGWEAECANKGKKTKILDFLGKSGPAPFSSSNKLQLKLAFYRGIPNSSPQKLTFRFRNKSLDVNSAPHLQITQLDVRGSRKTSNEPHWTSQLLAVCSCYQLPRERWLAIVCTNKASITTRLYQRIDRRWEKFAAEEFSDCFLFPRSIIVGSSLHLKFV